MAILFNLVKSTQTFNRGSSGPISWGRGIWVFVNKYCQGRHTNMLNEIYFYGGAAAKWFVPYITEHIRFQATVYNHAYFKHLQASLR